MAVASARPRSSRLWSAGFGLVALGLGIGPALGAGEILQVTKAWVSPADQVGIDIPLLMTITNATADADALLRVRCPFANFAEKHIVDRGEGSPAMRSIPSIPIPPNKAIVLKPDSYHVMLLQTRQRLVDGERLTCSIVFQKAGTIETEVLVSRAP
jgi:copper(I)-binding protein